MGGANSLDSNWGEYAPVSWVRLMICAPVTASATALRCGSWTTTVAAGFGPAMLPLAFAMAMYAEVFAMTRFDTVMPAVAGFPRTLTVCAPDMVMSASDSAMVTVACLQ